MYTIDLLGCPQGNKLPETTMKIKGRLVISAQPALCRKVLLKAQQTFNMEIKSIKIKMRSYCPILE